MDIQLPQIPAGIVTLLSLLSPYVIALITRSNWSPAMKRVVAVVAALVLAGVVMALYYVITHDTIPDWPMLLLLAVLVSQSSYALITKPLGAAALETASDEWFTAGESLRRDRPRD